MNTKIDKIMVSFATQEVVFGEAVDYSYLPHICTGKIFFYAKKRKTIAYLGIKTTDANLPEL